MDESKIFYPQNTQKQLHPISIIHHTFGFFLRPRRAYRVWRRLWRQGLATWMQTTWKCWRCFMNTTTSVNCPTAVSPGVALSAWLTREYASLDLPLAHNLMVQVDARTTCSPLLFQRNCYDFMYQITPVCYLYVHKVWCVGSWWFFIPRFHIYICN